MASLFDSAAEARLRASAPLADLLRPRKLDDVVGQQHLIGPNGALRRMVESGRLTSMILWGPAGTGKTTLARLVAATAGYYAESLSAVSSGVKDVREVLERARRRLGETGQLTVLFIDEVHRFNKSQQDLLLPATEAGEIVLIGATTENPYFEVNAALMSRTTLWRLAPLSDADLATLVERALRLRNRTVEADALAALVGSADGDARSLLTTLDTAIAITRDATASISRDDIRDARDGRIMHQSEDSHYDQVSAFIKSVRGSDPDAAVYWLLMMLEAGESPRFLARRLVILASEDIGLANNQALVVAEACARTVEFVGLPEARYALVHTTLALALSAKSNSTTVALMNGLAAVQRGGGVVPAHLRDAHYAAAATLVAGEGYQYPHDFPNSWVAQQYLPDALAGTRIYEPRETPNESRLVSEWRARTQSPPTTDGSELE